MKWLKHNFYNILAPVEETREWILYNTLSGGMELLSWEEGEYLSMVKEKDMLIDIETVEQHAFLKYLQEREYLTDISEPERTKFMDLYHKDKEMLYEREVANIGLTVGTTITCNMGCPYCFEFDKPNKSLRKEENLSAIISYLHDMVKKAPVKRWGNFFVVWYGGEPLINSSAIERLTPGFKELCAQQGMNYSAMIITNGLLLTQKNWAILKEHDVNEIQITIDGPEETHNKKRPLKASKGENYKKILSNIAQMPEGMQVVIRINVDRDIANRWDEFFADMYSYGIWPQRHKSVRFDPNWLRSYEEITANSVSNYLTSDEFFEELQSFRMRKLNLFNAWADTMNMKRARLSWTLPKLVEDCATWTSPYSLVVDPEGYIQKCWETIHDASNHIHHVSEGYHPEAFKKYAAYDKVNLNEICKNCAYLPVCDKLPCAFDALKTGKPDCTHWKSKLPSSLHDQYLLMKNNPDIMEAPRTNRVPAVNKTGHTNK